MIQNSTTKTDQENQNGNEGVFLRARVCDEIFSAHTQEGSIGKRKSPWTMLPLLVAFALAMTLGLGDAWGQTVVPDQTHPNNFSNTSASQTSTVPPGTYQVTIECWGGGGGGGNARASRSGAGGGGGGGYARYIQALDGTTLIQPGSILNVMVGAGGLKAVGGNGETNQVKVNGSAGGHSSVTLAGDTLARGGGGGGGIGARSGNDDYADQPGGAGGKGYSANNGTTKEGGAGGMGYGSSNSSRTAAGGGGGGAAGLNSNSTNLVGGSADRNNYGSAGSGNSGITIGNTQYSGNGGHGGRATNGNGYDAVGGSNYGGGGGGGARTGKNYVREGADGAQGFVRITYTIRTITVSFDANGGTGTKNPIQVLYLNSFSETNLTHSFTRSGYTFAGWNTQADGMGTTVDKDSICAFTADQTLYAQWEPVACYLHPEGGTFNTSCLTTCNLTVNDDGDVVFNFPASGNPLNSCLSGCENQIERVGYTFEGWFQKNGDDWIAVDFNSEYSGTGSLHVYAKWIQNTHTITLKSNGNSDYPAGFDAAMDNGTKQVSIKYDDQYQTATYNNEAGWSTNFGVARAGYKFKGWYGSATEAEEDATGENAIAPDSLFKHDNDNTELYAGWTKIYSITFNANGTEISPASFSGNQTIQAQIDANAAFNTAVYNNQAGWNTNFGLSSRTGYTFKGWYDTKEKADAHGDNFIDGSTTYPFTKDTTLYAGWEPKSYTLTFDRNYTTGSWWNPDPGTPKYGSIQFDKMYSTAVIPGETSSTWDNHYGFTRDGYTFMGWFTESGDDNYVNNTPVSGSALYHIDGNQTLYAGWARTYVCTLDVDGGDVPWQTSEPYTFNALVNQTLDVSLYNDKGYHFSDITKTGYQIDGWYRNKSGTNYYNEVEPSETQWTWNNNQTLYAKWVPKTVTITLVPGEGASLNDANTETYQLPYWITYLKEKVERKFIGDWSEYSTTYDIAKNVYGKRDQLESIETTESTSGMWTYRTTQYKPISSNYLQDPTRPGYDFLGWYTVSYEEFQNGTDTTSGDHVTNETELKSLEDHALYAYWTPKKYTCSLNPMGGELVPGTNCTAIIYNGEDDTYDFEVTYDSLYNVGITGCTITGNAVTRTGYTFEGWYWDSAYTVPLQNDYVWKITSNDTLYANWTANEYEVTLHSNGGSFSTVDTVFNATYNSKYGSKLVDIIPTRTGYVFRGWYYENNATFAQTEIFQNTTVTKAENHTLYARWEPKITVANIKQDSVSCYGYRDGKIIVENIAGGDGNYYYVTIKKGDTVFTQKVARPAEGTVSYTFSGAQSGVAWHDSIVAGVWDVYIYDSLHYSTFECGIPSYVPNPDVDDCDSTYAGTGQDACRFSLIGTVKVEEPEILAFTATPHPQTCYNQGSVDVTVTGGNGDYTVSWTGSTGISSQSGSYDLHGADTTISSLLAQNVTIHVTDQKNCPVEDKVVEVEQPSETVPAIGNDTATVCSGQEFILPKNRPAGVLYSWSVLSGEGCTGTGTQGGNMMPSVSGILTNNTLQQQVYIYQVTPYKGVLCVGTPFKVVVTVGPSRVEAPTTATVISPQVGCADSVRSIAAKFTAPVNNVTYQIDGDYGSGSMNLVSGGVDSFATTIHLPDTCEGTISFTVTALDQYGCSVKGQGSLEVSIANWSITAENGASEVACIRDAVTPNAPDTLKDGCGNLLTASEPRVDRSGFNGCSGTVVYTFTYTACDGSSDDWTYTYTVTGRSNDTLVVNNPFDNRDTIADVVPNRCLFKVPNLKEAFLNSIVASTTCTAPGNMTFVQNPAAGEFITENTVVNISIADSCRLDNPSRYKVTVTVPNRPAGAQVTYDPIVCNGQTTDATVTLTTQGTGTPTYAWDDDNHQTSATATGLSADSYTVVVTDENGCSTTGFVTISQPSAINVTMNLSRETICAGGNVVVSANVSGGTAPYQYQWNNNIGDVAVSPIQTLQTTTTYTLTVKDAKNCPADEESKTVMVNPLPTITVSGDAVICKDSTATITASGAVSYVWSSNQEQATITVTPSTTKEYTVTGTDANYCRNTATHTVTVQNLPAITIMNHPEAIAVNDSAVVGVRPLEDGETVTWSIENQVENTAGEASIITPGVTQNVACNVTSIKLKGLSVGKVVVSATITQTHNLAACNSITVSDTIVVKQSVINLACPTPSQDTIVYTGLPHSITTLPVVTNNQDEIVEGCTFKYSVDGENFTNIIPERTLVGTTQVTVMATHPQYDSNTCQYALTVNRRPVTVEVTECTAWTGNKLTTQIGDHYTVTNDDSTLLTGHALSGQVITSSAIGGVYTYNDGQEVNTASKTNVHVMNGEEDMTDNYNIIVHSVQTIMEMQVVSVEDVTCNGKKNGQIWVEVMPEDSITGHYRISSSIANLNHKLRYDSSEAMVYDSLPASNYTVYAENGSCQTNKVTNVAVTELEPLAITPADTTIDICAGAAIPLTATVTGGTMVYKYEWRDTRKDSVVGTTATVLNVLPLDTTVYTLTASDYYDGDCFATAHCTVNVRPGFPTQILAEADNVCMNTPLKLSEILNADDAHCTYQWSLGDGENGAIIGTATDSTVNVRWSTEGQKQVIVNVFNDSTECTSTGFYEITVNSLPSVEITSDQWSICPGQDSTVLVAAPTGEGMHYSWNVEGNLDTNRITVRESGNYTVTVTDINGCSGSVMATVKQYPLPTVLLNEGNTTMNICPGQTTATLTATPAEDTYVYIWLFGNTDTLNNGNPRTLEYSNLINVGPYRVKVIDSVGCYAYSNVVTLGKYVLPTVTVNSPTLCASGSATLMANGAQNYTWTPTTYLTVNNANAEFSGAPAGTYYDTVKGVDGHGCWDTAIATITVLPDVSVTYNAALLSQQRCDGTMLDSIKIHVDNGTLTFQGTLPSGVNRHDEGAGDYLIEGTVAQVGTFNYVLTAESNQEVTCPSQQMEGSIKVNPIPTVTFSPDTLDVCAGGAIDTVTITCTNGILPNAMNVPGLTYERISDVKARLYGTVANEDLSIPVEVTSDQTEPTCASLTDSIIVRVHPNPVVKIAEIEEVCPTMDTIVATATITSPTTADYIYYWTGGVWIDPMTTNTSELTNDVKLKVPSVCDGEYQVRVELTDAYHCTCADSVMMVVRDTMSPKITVASTMTAIAGTNCKYLIPNMRDSVTVTDGCVTGELSIEQDVEPGIRMADNVTEQLVKVVVLDPCGHKDSAMVTVRKPDPVQVTITAADSVCKGGSTTMTASATSGFSGAITFAWTPNTGLSATNVAQVVATPPSDITYTVTAHDANGCYAQASKTLYIYPLPLITIDPIAELCPGTTSTTMTAHAGPNGGRGEHFTYSWTTISPLSPSTSVQGNGLSNSLIINNIPNTCSGEYLVRLEVTEDGLGCKSKDSAMIVVKDDQGPTITPNFTTAWAVLDPNNTSGGCSYIMPNLTDSSYTVTDGCSPFYAQTHLSQDTAAGSPIAATTMVTITATDSCGNIGQTVVLVNVPNDFEIVRTEHNDVSCYGGHDGMVKINEVQGNFPPYLYYIDGELNSSTTFSNLSAGEHVITVVAANGCSATLKDTILQPDTFKMTLATLPATCANNDGQVTVSVEGGSPSTSGKFGFDYYGDLEYSSAPFADDQYSTTPAVLNQLAVGKYTVTVEDSKGCTIIDSFEIALNDNLQIDGISLPKPICSKGNIVVTVATSTPGSAAPATTYFTWPLPQQKVNGEIVSDVVGGTTAKGLSDQMQWIGDTSVVNETSSLVTLVYHATAHNGVCTRQLSDVEVSVTNTVHPKVVITPKDTTVCPNIANLQLMAHVANVTMPSDTLMWTFNNELVGEQTHAQSQSQYNEYMPVTLPATSCEADYIFRVEYSDGVCTTYGAGNVSVRIPDQFTIVPPAFTDTIVSCVEDIVEPHLVPSKWPSLIMDGCGRVIDSYDDVDYPVLATVCNQDVVFVYTFKDCTIYPGHDTTYRYTYHVIRPDMTLPANGAATVICESDAVKPNSPGNLLDACGDGVVPVFPDSTAANPNPVHNVVDGSGTVTYTYTYTTCDGKVFPWKFVYTVVPEPFTPFANVEKQLSCRSEMASDTNPVPVPDTTICGNHIDFTLDVNYPQPAVFNTNCGTRTYLYHYRVNGEDYDWTYTEKVQPEDFEMPANAQRIVACYSEIDVQNIPLPTVTDACGDVLQPTSQVPVIYPTQETWNKCMDTVRCTYTYKDCADHTHEWVYTWVVKDTLTPTFTAFPQSEVPAHHGMLNGKCVYAYPTTAQVTTTAENACHFVDDPVIVTWNHQSYDDNLEIIEQTDEIQYLPVVVTATTCGVSKVDSFYVMVPAKLRIEEVLSSHKDVKCYGGYSGEIRVRANGGTQPYTYSISELAAVQTQAGYFTGLPVPVDSTLGTDEFGGIWYGNDTLTVVDDHGCDAEMVVEIKSPVELVWENCPDTVTLCADPGKDFCTVTFGVNGNVPDPNLSTIANSRPNHTSYKSQYTLGPTSIHFWTSNRTCMESARDTMVIFVLPNSTLKDSADNAIQEVCPGSEIDPIVFTFADADSVVLSGSLPESLVTYNTTQVSEFRTETQVTISGVAQVTEPTVYDYTFTAYSQTKPGSTMPCSEVTYSGAITIHDTVAPTYARPENVEIYLTDACQVDNSTEVTGVPTDLQDNCSDQLTVTFRDEDSVADCGGAYHFNRVWRVVDPSGNVSRSDSIQLITVLDTVRPVIAAGYQTEYPATPNSNCNSDVPNVCADILAHASDNCNGALTAEQLPAAGTEILEDTDVTVTVKDACGNATSTTVHVTANGVVAITIDSVDAGCYHTLNDGAVFFTVQGGLDSYMTYVDGRQLTSFNGANMVDSLPYGDSLAIVVIASMPDDQYTFCQTRKYFNIHPIADTLKVTANSHEWEYDNTEHQDATFTVKFGDNIVTTNAASGSEVELPNHDKVKATVTGAITDAGTVTNVLSNVMVLRGADTVTCKYNQVLNNGTLTVTPAEITVTITGHNLTAAFDGVEHYVSGYDVNISDEFYTTANFVFNGDSTLNLTNAGTVNMNLAPAQFVDQWPTPNNIETVNFVIAADGYLTINKINATVHIAGHQSVVDYDGYEHQVNGYETIFSTPLYSRADFDFTGDSLLTRTNAGIDSMHLAAGQFSNHNGNFDTVTFVIDQDGFLKVNPIDVTVTVTGHNNTADYDNTEHMVTGYDLQFSTPLYTENDFTFTGSDTAKRTFAGTTYMGLAQAQFANINPNFDEVTFNVTDGYQTITPINAVVTIVGNKDTVDFDGESHTVTGYVATATPAFYNVDTSFTFSGDSTATRMNAGTTYMNLAQGQFANTNPNFAQVDFEVTDGAMIINKINAIVTVTGHHDVVDYDAAEHTVSGYDVTFSTPLYSRADFAFNGDSALARTNAGTDYMNLAPEQFSNTNTTNFNEVSFEIAADGYLTINKIDATVTIKGQRDTAVYDGQLHNVSGYAVQYSTPYYTAADFAFNGTAAASRTHVVEGNDQSGISYMGLTPAMFTNLNEDNFDEVNFVVEDGYQRIDPLAVTVTITGHHQYNLYDGQEHVVSGFDTAYSTNLYSGADFTFTPAANADLVNGVISARRTDYDTTYMGLAANQFANINTDFAPVTFEVTDGYQAILTKEVTVTIVGHHSTADYDGSAHTVTGYDVTTNNALYSAVDFDYSGDSTATRTNAGTQNMGLAESQFTNHNQNFGPVHFVVTDGYQTINKIDVEVAVKGTRDTVDYDGNEHSATGFDFEFSTPLYQAQYVHFNGQVSDSTASRTDAGTQMMGLAANMFSNNSTTNFNHVTFTVEEDGAITVLPIDATVTITGNHASNEYDAAAHTVTGYTASANTALYDVTTSFSFNGEATATRTMVDTTWMDLTSDMFTNTNTNFATVTFTVVDGYQAITPASAVVTIRGNVASNNYDGAAHTVTGYTATAEPAIYDVATSFTFSGDSTATRTHVKEGSDESGKTYMGLANTMFVNTNPNFSTVTFVIDEDGYQQINPINATVTITGHNHSDLFDNAEHFVSGFDTAYSTNLYSGADFTFTPANSLVMVDGKVAAKRTIVGTTYMGLADTMFQNTNTDFANVTFNVTDGYQKIEPRNVVVTITGRSATVGYNGAEQKVTGYDVSFSNEFYTEADFEFQGNPADSTASGTNVGTYTMNLQTSQFVNTSVDNFDTVTFVVTNGSLTIEQVPATVTITGKQSTVNYDGAAHTITGYSAVAEPSFYNVGTSFTFSGDSTATRTNVVEGTDNSGKTYMGLADTMFVNTNPNFSTVTFVIAEDGYQQINPINATVTIVGKNNTANYDGAAHTITGYTATANTNLYDVNNSFVFNGNVADSTATRTNVVEGDDNSGKTYMGMTSAMFENKNTNFAEVTFNVTDGYQVINPINAEVTIVGNHATNTYDGAAHTITGFVATANPTLYDVTNSFVFNGNIADSTATRTEVFEGGDTDGKTNMGLTNAMFENTNTNFATVSFTVTDGYQEITPREVTVTVKGHVDTVFFDNTPKQVTGFDVAIGDPMYAATNYTYDGTEADSTVTEITVGTFYMNLQGKFSNHNDNFDVTFDVTNGHLTILSNDVVVIIRGNHDSLTYNGQAQTVTGYEVVNIDHLTYTAADFKFTGTQADSTATRTYIGTDSMGLTPDMFENTNNHYSNVTFVIEQDGYVTVTPMPVEVMVKGNNDTAAYNGAPHTITGFKVSTESTLYDIASCEFHGTVNDSTATRTDAGTTYMGLAASQFVNTDTNFHVTFNVTDGYQYVKKDTVYVTVTGMTSEVAYDGTEHTVTGYSLVSNDPDYNPYANVMNVNASASLTNVGTEYMGLTAAQFVNNNPNYVVNFVVAQDGYVKVNPKDVHVSVVGNTGYFTFDNNSHTVSGYTVTADDNTFDVGCITYSGIISAVTWVDEGTAEMGLQANLFQNSCQNDNVNVTIEVTDGWITILPAGSVVVTIKGHCDTATYDGIAHNVSGYDVVAISSSDYTVNDFTFNGTVADSTATRTNVVESGNNSGKTYMGLTSAMFTPNNSDVNMIFDVTDGYQMITPVENVVVTVQGAQSSTVEYDGQPHSVSGYTVTANPTVYPVNDVQYSLTVTPQATRTNAGTTYMGLNASQFTLPVNANFSNVSLVVNDGSVTVTKKPLTVKSFNDTVFHKVYDGTPLVVSYDQLVYDGIVNGDVITQGVITTESAAVGNYVCGAGYTWAYADNENGAAAPSGFGEPSVTQNYNVSFDVKLRIDSVTELNCPAQLNIVLFEGTADTSLTDAQLGTINNELVAAGVATVKSNIETLNPLSVGTHTVTWTIYDIAGTAMTTCDQTVVVEYAPCQAISYNGYTYPAKRIGAQCWMTENLRTQKDSEGNTIADYHPYKDNAAEFQKFGYLYTWYSAVGVAENNNTAAPATMTGANGQPYVQGICPEGWAVPSVADYQELYDTVVDVLLLKDAGDEYWYPGMGGVLPNSGFNSRAGGFYNSLQGRYEDLLTGDHYWKSNSVPGSTNAESGNVNYFCDSSTNNQAPKTDRRSVRCIKKM